MDITKLSLLLGLRDYYHFQLGQHAADFMLGTSKPGHEQYFVDSKRRLAIVDELITTIEGEE